MKHIIKYGLGCLTWVASSIMLLSCGDEDAASNLPAAICPSSIEFNLPLEVRQLIYVDETKANVLPLVKGEKVELNYTMQPDNVSFDEVVWSSSNQEVATVDNGKVTAVSGNGTGYSVVQVAPEAIYSGSNVFSSLKVVVVDQLVEAQTITLDSKTDEVYAGETLQLSATILPANATYKTVKWTSSNEAIATVDMSGLVTGKVNNEVHAKIILTATSLDNAHVIATKELTVNQIVQPESVSINQDCSADNEHVFAIADKKVQLNYTTTPADCTKSLIQWSTSDDQIATVSEGTVSFNQNGVFGEVTITATCPQTGHVSSIKLHLAEGLIREQYYNKENYTWYNAAQSGNGTSSSHVWSYGKVTVTTYKQNATNQRGDFKCWSPKTWLNSARYPIIAIRMDDLKDMDGVTLRNITLDGSGTCNGATYSGGLGGNNNQWLHDYKCSDGSHVFIYNLATQAWGTGGVMPTSSLATFTGLQFKYADIRTLTTQVQYNVYWVQTFKTIDEVKEYVESEGLTYSIIK